MKHSDKDKAIIRKYEKNLTESSVRELKKAYLNELKEKCKSAKLGEKYS